MSPARRFEGEGPRFEEGGEKRGCGEGEMGLFDRSTRSYWAFGWKWAENGSLWSEGRRWMGKGGGGGWARPRRDEIGVSTVPATERAYSWRRPDRRPGALMQDAITGRAGVGLSRYGILACWALALYLLVHRDLPHDSVISSAFERVRLWGPRDAPGDALLQ